MRRRTTIQKLHKAISNNLLQIAKAEIYNKTSRKTETIDIARFKDYFGSLCKSGIFTDALGWHYEQDQSGRYIAETGRYNPHSDIIITAYFSVNDDVSDDEVEKMLHVEESED